MEFLKNIYSSVTNLGINNNDDLGNVNVIVEPVKEILETTFEVPTKTIRDQPIDNRKPKRIFKYASDLHLEMRKDLTVPSLQALKPIYQFDKEENTRYFLALVGDIGSPIHKSNNLIEFLGLCSQVYEQVFYVMGNHEYYNITNKVYTMEEIHSELKLICSQFPNVHLLENQVYQLDEYKIIGSTLWSSVQINPQQVERCLNDYNLIKTFDLYGKTSCDGKLKTRRITVDDTNQLHNFAVDFLKKEIFGANQNPCIVLTHHAPQFNDHKRGTVWGWGSLGTS